MFKRMLAVVRRIPRGKVATYGDIAYAAGYPGSARQVVWALRTARDVPWHRILGAGGKILLPGEMGFEQRMRLMQEGVQLVGELRVDMSRYQHKFFKKTKTAARSTNAKKKSPTRKSSKRSARSINR